MTNGFKLSNWGLNWGNVRRRCPKYIKVIKMSNLDDFIKRCNIIQKLFLELVSQYESHKDNKVLIKKVHSDMGAIYKTLDTIDRTYEDIIDIFKALKLEYPYYKIFDNLITDPVKDEECIRDYISIVRFISNYNDFSEKIAIKLINYRILMIL
ncbi:MAG: hypothetical protein ACFE91_13390 [Promethearchaeota archaeon]